MSILISGETEITSETDIRAGSIGFFGVNDAFDLYLVKLSNNNYRLIVFMKIQFSFEDADNNTKWTPVDKILFIHKWKTAIKQKWGNRVIKKLTAGKNVEIDFRFKTKIGGWMFDHWEITVKKVTHYRKSTVNVLNGSVSLDSLDLKLSRTRIGYRQRGAVHEFGHMLGIDDEYQKESLFHKNYKSVMNTGETIFKRHDFPYMEWLEKKLKEKNIK